MKLLIGYEGSEQGQTLFDDLARAGLGADVEARVVTVANVWPHLAVPPTQAPAGAGSQVLRAAQEARQLAREAVEKSRLVAVQGAAALQERFASWQVTGEAAADAPHSALIQLADRWQPDLLVVGSHNKSTLSRLMLGSVSQSVLNHARCSVRISRAPSRSDAMRLVVGVDGSSHAELAVELVARRHWPAGTQVRVVSALDLSLATTLPDPVLGTVPITPELTPDQWVRQLAEDAAQRLREAGVDAHGYSVEGDPRAVLVELAQGWEADAIYLGAKGHSRFERLLLGSVSSSVAARAHCSVEVVRPAESR